MTSGSLPGAATCEALAAKLLCVRCQRWFRTSALSLSLALLTVGCHEYRDDRPIASVAVDGQRLLVPAGCYPSSDARAKESEQSMELRLSTSGASMGDCLHCEEVTLDEPLGDRPMVDRATGDEIPNGGPCEGVIQENGGPVQAP